MSNIDEIIKAAENLCASLDETLRIEKKICQDISYELEMLLWEMHMTSNNLKCFKEKQGV